MKNNLKFVLPLCVFLILGVSIPEENKSITADTIINRIKSNVTCDWQEETVDTYKGGNPKTEVTGIATTFLATLEVLKKAKAKGLNMIITHEPIFYNHYDKTNQYGENDAIVLAKQKYIEENGLVVFRFHDHIHQTSPDGIYKGVVNKLGWTAYEKSQNPYVYKLPRTTLENLSEELKKTFNTPTIRVVGNPKMELTTISLVLGAAGAASQIKELQRNEVEVLIIGETHEWETVEYVRDAITLGKNKALIIVGHANSEESGMEYCAEWLQTFITEVPIEFIAAEDPFWTPK